MDPLSSSEETSNERRGERKEKGEEKGRPEICLSKAVEGVGGEKKEKEGGREGGGGDSKRAARFEAFFPRSIEGVPGPKQNEKKKSALVGAGRKELGRECWGFPVRI